MVAARTIEGIGTIVTTGVIARSIIVRLGIIDPFTIIQLLCSRLDSASADLREREHRAGEHQPNCV
jgi:hypothetical protein